MGDENSLSGTTKAHKHSALSSDGGFLETSVTGVTNLSEGSIVYGNATEIVTELSAGSEGDSLKIASGVPSWGAGASSTWTNEGSDSGDDVTTLEVSVSEADIYQVIWCVSDQDSATTTLTMRLNNISTSTYDTMKGTLADGGTMGGSEYTAIPKWLLGQQGGGGKMNSGYATVYKANSDFLPRMAVGASFVANNMQNTTEPATPNNSFNTGINETITGAITTITLEFINDSSTTRQNITGNMQVNSMSY